MSAITKVVTREELHGLVWTRPFVKLGRELGFTYLEFINVCSDLNIPRPAGNYWYRKERGIAEERTPLPAPSPGMRTEIEINPDRFPVETPPIDSAPVDNSSKSQKVEHAVPEGSQPTAAKISKVEKAAVESPDSGGTNDSKESKVTSQPERPADVEYTREQLYEAIWSTSCVKLAATLGISDVALAKTCRRLGIPRPPPGYWAKIEAGAKPKREPLPSAKQNENHTVTFCVAENIARREEWAAKNILTADRARRAEIVELPPEGSEKHPIVERHERALEKAKPGELGFVTVRGKNLFLCDMSAALAPKLARALQAVICELEDRDFDFEPGINEFAGLQIVRDDDKASLQWSEEKLVLEREPTQEDKKKPSWTWQLHETKPSGKLSIEVNALGLKGKRKWTESDEWPLEKVLGIVIQKVEAIFRGFEDKRNREAEWEKQRREEAKREAEREAVEAEKQARVEKARKERERINRHEAKLEKIAEQRSDNLASAAQEWIEMQGILAYVQFCEERWRREGAGTLSKEQTDWLSWARASAAKMEPKGYPNPPLDGGFDASAVPVGGPYPETRKWETDEPEEAKPPEIKPPAYSPPPPEPFPYWHLHRHH